MKSTIRRSAIILTMASVLLWSIGCSASQNSTISDASSSTESTDSEDSSQTKLVNGLLLLGGIALTVGGVVYVASKIDSAIKSSSASEPGVVVKF